jgi:predicted aldo/keto reductase-like oxidoreductase
MSKKGCNWSRRDFLKTAGLAGVGSLINPVAQTVAAADNPPKVPKRRFGKTGVDVSVLSVGGTMNLSSNLLLLRQAFKWGVTYWDTAHSYRWGKSEEGIGKYLNKYPDDRKEIFLVTKSGAWTMSSMTDDLHESLERMQTDYIDLFFVHGISGIDELDEDTKVWAEKAKASGKIHFFGFSTHSNMENCLLGAAKLGWVDGIMMTYNYRLMHTDPMKRAVDACVNAGIGLTAMKTQGGGQVKSTSELELQLAGRFLKKGFTDGQAKLKAVWENPQITTICSRMTNMTFLMANTAAALDKTRLSAIDTKLLQQYARETHSDYCTGCTAICESAVDCRVPIGDVMRYLMYCRSYGNRDEAVANFRKIPFRIRKQMADLDYSLAEKRCPQSMAIARLMKAAINELS